MPQNPKRSCAIVETEVKPRKAASGAGHFCFHCCWFWFTTAFLSYWLVASRAFLEPSSTLINKFCCAGLNIPQLCHTLLLFCLPWKYMNALWMFRQLSFWDWKRIWVTRAGLESCKVTTAQIIFKKVQVAYWFVLVNYSLLQKLFPDTENIVLYELYENNQFIFSLTNTLVKIGT